METRIVLTNNKHAYARVQGGVLVVRIPKWLPVKERDVIIARLQNRPHLQTERPDIFDTIMETGEVCWAWGDRWHIDVSVIRDKKLLRERLTEEAKTHWLPQVTAELRNFAVQMGSKRPLGEVHVRDLKSRWGSCSAQGNITISLATLLLPYPLFSYVCAHEVAHLTHLHHQPAFWHHLQSAMPDALHRRRQLRTYQPA